MKRLAPFIAVLSILAFATAAGAAKGGIKGKPVALAAPGDPVYVPDAVWGTSVTGTTTFVRDTEPIYAFIQCYLLDGTYVHATYVPKVYLPDPNAGITDGTFETRALSSRLWPNQAGTCTATVGYFLDAGFGPWVPLGATTFNVSEADVG